MQKFIQGYGLVIGINQYKYVSWLPESVLQDANDITATLRAPNFCGYEDEKVRPLINEHANIENVRASLKWLSETTTSADTCIIYFSGHGGVAEPVGTSIDSKENYLLMHQSQLKDLAGTALSGYEISKWLGIIPAGRTVVIFDCCYAGGIGTTKEAEASGLRYKKGLETSFYDRLAQGQGQVIFASSSEGEVSLILNGMKNSLFTHYFLEAMRGKAFQPADNLIRVFQVFEYVSKAVSEHADQHPIFRSNLQDNFPVALYCGGRPALAPAETPDYAALRDFILSGFSEEDLHDFCSVYFPDVLYRWSAAMSLRQKAAVLITYARNHGYAQDLHDALKHERPHLTSGNAQ